MKRRLSSRAVSTIIFLVVAIVTIASLAIAQSGSIGLKNIEIDINANLYPGDGNANILNPGAVDDWVKDSLANTDTPTLVNSVAEGVEIGVTGAAKVGHWNGVRVVDTIGNSELDIFVKGGKENDVTSWEIDAGSVGSSKYDISQAYIANNNTKIFFGMERSGNNGTTAFDFEFNQLPPDPDTQHPNGGFYIPNRSAGDVLFTFELQGSGGSGSATPHIYLWDGSKYDELLGADIPAGLISSINTTVVPAAPWGYVNDKGAWALGNIPKFEFAEAQVPFGVNGILEGVEGCGGTAYVQVRTRSSSTASSDLKDTTRIFEYIFGGPEANLEVKAICDGFTYEAKGSKDSLGGNTQISDYDWTFEVPSAAVVLSGTGITQVDSTHYSAHFTTDAVRTVAVSFSNASAQPATIKVSLIVTENGSEGCTDDASPGTKQVYSSPTASASLTGCCSGLSFDYTGSATGGSGTYGYAWDFYKKQSDGTYTKLAVGSSSASGTYTPATDGTFKGILKVTDTGNGDLACFDTDESNIVDAKDFMNPTIEKQSANANTLVVTLALDVHEADEAIWEVSPNGTTWTELSTDDPPKLTLNYSSFETDDASPSIKNTPFSQFGYSFVGKLYETKVRVRTKRTLNGESCEETSNVLSLAKLLAVDP